MTANKFEEPLDRVSYTMDRLSQKDFKRQSLQTVGEALRDLSGVDIGMRGLKGEDTDVRIRGSDRDEVLVLLDGIPIHGNNESRAYFMNLIPLENVERIEVLKGSQSILYGSDAVGGVINIITRKGKPGREFNFQWEAGNLSTFKETLMASGGNETTFASAAYSRTDQGGMGPNSRLGANAFSGRFTHYLAPDFSIELGSHFIQAGQEISKNQITVFTGVLNDYVVDDSNADRSLYFTNNFIRVSAPLAPMVDSKLLYGFNFLREKVLNSNQGDAPVDENGAALEPNSQHFRSHSYRHYIDWLNDIEVLALEDSDLRDVFQVGFSLTADHLDFISNSFEGDAGVGLPFSSSYPTPGAKANRQNYAIYFQNNFQWRSLVVTGGMRFDRNTTFGDELSPRASIAYEFEKTKTKIKGTYSEGFHAPTIAEFFDATIGGTPTALPIKRQQELSQSYEAGVEQRLWADRIFLRTVYFFIDYDRLLDIIEAVDDASVWGIEADARIKPWEWLEVGTNYTFNRSHNDEDGSELTMRPRHRFNVYGSVEPVANLTVRADLNQVSSRLNPRLVSLTIGDFPVQFFDSNNRASDRVDGYVTLDLSARYRLPQIWKAIDSWEVFARGLNLLDDQYEESYGYPMPGIQFYAGTQFRF